MSSEVGFWRRHMTQYDRWKIPATSESGSEDLRDLPRDEGRRTKDEGRRTKAVSLISISTQPFYQSILCTNSVRSSLMRRQNGLFGEIRDFQATTQPSSINLPPLLASRSPLRSLSRPLSLLYRFPLPGMPSSAASLLLQKYLFLHKSPQFTLRSTEVDTEYKRYLSHFI
jgi:hypothetical protein